jgi:hypothetical protein
MGSLRSTKSVAEWQELVDHLDKSLEFISKYKELGTPAQLEEIIEECKAYRILGTPEQIQQTLDTVVEFAEFHKEQVKKLEQRLDWLETRESLGIIGLLKIVCQKIIRRGKSDEARNSG